LRAQRAGESLDAALQKLKEVKAKPLYRVNFAPEVRRETDSEITAAERGDRSVLEASVQRNC
jgi:hypothetical protein